MTKPISKSTLNDIIVSEVRKALKESFKFEKKDDDDCGCQIEEQFVSEGSHEATELENYISNDRNLYQQYKAIIKNLKNKVTKGVYNPEKAITLWMYLVTAGVKKYVQENGVPGDMFPKSVRIEVAKSFRDASADVIGVQMPVMEQNSRMPGDKLSADEDPMADFDTSKFYEDDEDKLPEEEKLPEQRMFDDDTDDADIFSNSAEEKFFSAKVPPRKPEKSFKYDILDDDENIKIREQLYDDIDDDMFVSDDEYDNEVSIEADAQDDFDDDFDAYSAFDGMDIMGPEGTETFDRDKHVPTPSEYTEEDALLDAQEAEEEQGLYTEPETGAVRDDSFWGRM